MRTMLKYVEVAWQGRTWRELVYLLLGLPISIVLFTYVVTMYAVGMSLVIIWIGVVILVAVQESLRPLASFERVLANALLGAQAEAPPRVRGRDDPRWLPRMLATFHDGPSWRALGWITLRIVLGPVGFALAVVALVVPVTLVGAVVIAFVQVAGVWETYGLLMGDAESIASFDTVATWVAIASPLLLLIAVMPFWAVRGLGDLHLHLARWGLGACDRELAEEATARAELAEAQLRIDQELHDSIGHMITMNIVQAGAGAHVFDSDPEFARQALRNIEERGRAAMGELDRIIAHLRGDEAAERAPLPTLDDIAGLVETSRRGGAKVAVSVDADGVPPAIARTVFGIVREALTNAAKHAPGAPIDLRVAREEEAIGVAVTSGRATAAPTAAHSTGRGVTGIRDRVALLGGRTRIGPTDGGFEVVALIPLGTDLAPHGDPTAPWATLRERVAT